MNAAAIPPSQAGWRSRVAFPLIVYLVLRLALGLWASVSLTINPLPAAPDEAVRPYLGAPVLVEGPSGWLLGPWQRFDANRYVRIAVDGYAAPEDSVFPPLFPWLMRAIAHLMTGADPHIAALAGGLVVSSVAGVAAFALFLDLAERHLGRAGARRALIYLAVFPTSFYLFAPYSESLFLLWVLATFSALDRKRPWLAGVFALLATLTRTTGVVLALPLAAGLWRRAGAWPVSWGRLARLAPAALPAVGLAAFLAYRAWLGLPSIDDVYAAAWLQETGLPARDMGLALRVLLTGEGPRAGEFTLLLDWLTAWLLLTAGLVAWRRFGPTFGLYALAMLGFLLLPHSELKPLYSFTRYALVAFPLYWWWGSLGANPWRHRLILYGSGALLLYLSGQFFAWGWVA